MNNSKLVRGALLVALALALQSLRLVLPMPQLLTAVAGILLAEQVKKRLRQFD